MNTLPDSDRAILAWIEARERIPYVFWRLLAIRDMINHRGISRRELANGLGVSLGWVHETLRPEGTRSPGTSWANNSHSYDNQLERMDRIEAYITEVTDQAGSLQARCGCTDEAMRELVVELRKSTIAREEVAREFRE